MKGIDVSYANGYVDWDAVKNAGVKFAMCRSSYGRSGFDDTFQRNVNEATKRGIKCGAYHYSYALDANQAAQEAVYCKSVIDRSGVLLELPVFFDMEDADQYKRNRGFMFSRANVTNICKAFFNNFPYNKGIYASEDWLDRYIDWRSLNCPVWNASWGSRRATSFAEANKKADGIKGYMWQFTDSLIIGGKEFDGDIIYDNEDVAVW